METCERQERLWRFLCRAGRPLLKKRFCLDAERLPEGQPVILVCNHVTDLDPVLLALASPDHMITYVASDHILRNRPFLRKMLYRCFSPITRRKAASAVDTCRKTVQAVREGKTVCIFAEGETTWNGRSAPIKPGTGTLVKAAGVPLVTYRFQGGYFTSPRWGKGPRRGKIKGRVTGYWPAEALKAMNTDEVNALIREGIREDAFETQRRESFPGSISGKKLLDGIEALLFLCPECGSIGTLRGRGRVLSCGCGLTVRVDQGMLPEGPAPFPDFTAWDEWQVESLNGMIDRDPSFRLAECQDDLILTEICPDGPREAARGALSMDRDYLRVGETALPAAGIRDMATLQNRKLAISAEDRYYELQAPEALCLRKYLLFRQHIRETAESVPGKEA